jgi:hypothetical protein
LLTAVAGISTIFGIASLSAGLRFLIKVYACSRRKGSRPKIFAKGIIQPALPRHLLCGGRFGAADGCRFHRAPLAGPAEIFSLRRGIVLDKVLSQVAGSSIGL